MKFIVKRGHPFSYRVFYDSEGFAFDCEPQATDTYAMLLINNVTLEVDGDGNIISVWGYCPKNGWQEAAIKPEGQELGQLQIKEQSVLKKLVPGVHVSLSDPDEWPRRYNSENGWFCLGVASSKGRNIQIAQNVLVTVDNEEITALWVCLKPV